MNKEWAREHLRGIENCIFPSFDPELRELDEEGIRLDVRQTIKHGFTSTLVTTETGLTLDEAKRLVEIVVDEADGRLSVSLTLLRNSFAETIEIAQHAAKVGAQTALLGFPMNFYPSSPEEVYEATKRLCDAADLGFLVYATHKFNLFRFHPSGWPLDLLDRMTEIDNVIGVKVGILEPGFIHEVFARLGEKIVVQVPWERWWPLLASKFGLQYVGAGAYELFQSPEKRYLVDYFNLLLEGRTEDAMEIYWRLTPVRVVFEKQFMPTQQIGTYHWPQQKYYQWLVGGNGGYTRQPVMKLLQQEMDEARAALRAIGIETSENDAEFFTGRTAYARAGHEVGVGAG